MEIEEIKNKILYLENYMNIYTYDKRELQELFQRYDTRITTDSFYLDREDLPQSDNYLLYNPRSLVFYSVGGSKKGLKNLLLEEK